jgi:lysine-N-methylase
LHERFGADVKPFACRLFPFLLIPAGDHWRLGMRFSCPSVAANQGRPVTAYEGDLVHLSHLIEKHLGRSGESAPPPPLQAGQSVPWTDVARFVQVLVEIVQDRSERLEWRLRQCLALARLCRQARFDQVSGGRLSEFLKLLRTGLEGEVPRRAAEVPAPGWIGRVLFRTLLAIFARKDRGLHQGPATRSRLGRVLAGWRFVRGRGRVPRVNSFLAEITFADVEGRGALPPEVDEILERYYLVKLSSLQFCGPPNFDLPFWDGLASLVLTLPLILWLARAFTGLAPVAAVQQAIVLVDNHFGGNPLLGSRHVRFYLRTLAQRGEVERLVAWYSR